MIQRRKFGKWKIITQSLSAIVTQKKRERENGVFNIVSSSSYLLPDVSFLLKVASIQFCISRAAD